MGEALGRQAGNSEVHAGLLVRFGAILRERSVSGHPISNTWSPGFHDRLCVVASGLRNFTREGAEGLQSYSTSFRCAGRWKRNRLYLGQVELAGGVIDIEPDDIALCVEIDDEAFDNLPRLDTWGALELDIETVRLGIVVQFHRSSSLKLRSKNALGIVSPSASVTTRRGEHLD